MIIDYKNYKLRKICESKKEAEKALGRQVAETLGKRLKELQLLSLEKLLRNKIGGCHKLKGDRNNQYAMSLHNLFRLIFVVKKTETSTIIEIVDYD